MVTIGAFEAKTKLSELLERVSKGESFMITKHGQPVAKLVPTTVGEPKEKISTEELIERFRKIRESVKPGPPSFEEIVREAKRHKY